MRGMVVAAMMAAVLTGAARAETTDQLYAKAKAEGALVLWGAGPTAGYETAVKAFEAKYPGIKVSLTDGFSNVLNAKVEEQVKARQ